MRPPRRPARRIRPQVFAWLLAESHDPWRQPHRVRVRAGRPGRDPARRQDASNGHVFRQRLLRSVRWVDFDDGSATRFLVSVTFEYDYRPDRFSDYRAGFELRPRSACKRIVVRTHADPDLPQPVRRTSSSTWTNASTRKSRNSACPQTVSPYLAESG